MSNTPNKDIQNPLVQNIVDMISNSAAEILKLQNIEALLEKIISHKLKLVNADAGGLYLYREKENIH